MAEVASGMPGSCAQCMATKGRDSPWASWAQALPWGQHPKALPPKDAGQRGPLRMGACHRCVTVPPPSNAAVTMPQGRLKGAILPCPASLPGSAIGTQLALGQHQDIHEELLEEPVELLGGG